MSRSAPAASTAGKPRKPTHFGSPTALTIPAGNGWQEQGLGGGAWFASLWAVAILLHLAANDGHLLAGDRIGLAQLLLTASAAVTLLWPSARAVGALTVTYLVVFWMKSPVVGNHEVLLALGSAALTIAVSRRPESWAAMVAPAGRWVLLVAYGFIAFSKLNWGFFDPARSCALLFGQALGGALGMAQGQITAMGPMLIAATAIIELAIPVLLIWPRFRRFGVMLALAFHFVLALDPVGHVWDFSATLLPLFLLFTPSSFGSLLDRKLARISSRPILQRALVVGLVIGLHGIVMSDATALPRWIVAYPVWLLLSGTVGVWVIRFASGDPGPGEPVAVSARVYGGWRPARCLIPVIAATVVVGLGPYLQIRTAAAFNMYSNLRVIDGSSNHVLIGALDDGQPQSVVEVVQAGPGSVLAYYLDKDLLLPIENLDRHLLANPDEQVLVRHGDTVIDAAELGIGTRPRSGGVWHRVASELRHKFGFRRAVPDSPDGACLRAWGPLG